MLNSQNKFTVLENGQPVVYTVFQGYLIKETVTNTTPEERSKWLLPPKIEEAMRKKREDSCRTRYWSGFREEGVEPRMDPTKPNWYHFKTGKMGGYICGRCSQEGHYLKDCPTNSDPDYDLGLSEKKGIEGLKIEEEGK